MPKQQKSVLLVMKLSCNPSVRRELELGGAGDPGICFAYEYRRVLAKMAVWLGAKY